MNEKLAKQRFMLLNAVRLAGLAMVMVALAIYYGKIPAPTFVAYILAAIGMVDYFFMPNFLARKWRSPDA